ncbi:unnamed protein product [Cylindrotheca closterium]|uniref:Oxidation resistance protein 1 n=1 Tax=Cylindrotheca closterium TaxID=2856 RepID=A0AAD2G130_9STRA|nr:unnamed protein product [Cylindrotheca closterium]
MATKFRSKPLDIDGYFTGSNARDSFSEAPMSQADSNAAYRQSIFSASYLTANEKIFLEELLQSEDHESIQLAGKRLADKTLFPPSEDESPDDDENNSSREPNDKKTQSFGSEGNKAMNLFERDILGSGGEDRSFAEDFDAWREELLQDDEKQSTSISAPTTGPFNIFGLSSDASLIHPRVLSPSLMESLLAFVPESIQISCNFWLKYSMVRDGASLLALLRHCRASANTVLAIETNEGFVFGSFTSQPWQLSSLDGFYGSDESFVWRMRHSRHDDNTSAAVLMSKENKIDVYPCTSKNDRIQFCCKEFLALGEGELEDMKVEGENHFGNAIRLEKSMTHGSTSTSNTFDNPSLIRPDKRGEEFTVQNIEVWSLTPHSSSSAAIRAEMRSLFLEDGKKAKALNLLEILVS